MSDTITGSKFIDNFIEKKGLLWWVRFLGVLGIIGGSLYILNAFTTIADSARYFSAYNREFGVKWLMQYAVASTVIFGLLAIIAGAGFLKLREWAAKLTIGLSVFKILWASAIFIIKLMNDLSKTSTTLMGFLDISATFVASVVSFGLLIYLLLRSRVREQFL